MCKKKYLQMPKLTYFSSRGLLEPLRILLAEASVDYVPVHLGNFHEGSPPESFAALKSSGVLDFGAVPLWEEDGLQLVQSASIVRHIARKYGYNGENEIEASKIDSVVEGCKDLSQALRKHANVPADQKLKVWKDIVTIDAPKWLGYFENLLKKNTTGSGYFVGTKLSYADIFVAYYIEEIKSLNVIDFAAYPLLSAHFTHVYSRPAIAAYVNSPTRFPSVYAKIIPQG